MAALATTQADNVAYGGFERRTAPSPSSLTAGFNNSDKFRTSALALTAGELTSPYPLLRALLPQIRRPTSIFESRGTSIAGRAVPRHPGGFRGRAARPDIPAGVPMLGLRWRRPKSAVWQRGQWEIAGNSFAWNSLSVLALVRAAVLRRDIRNLDYRRAGQSRRANRRCGRPAGLPEPGAETEPLSFDQSCAVCSHGGRPSASRSTSATDSRYSSVRSDTPFTACPRRRRAELSRCAITSASSARSGPGSNTK